MNMTGGKITDNEATNAKSDGGGGVEVTAGTFIMSSGEISNNTSPRYGGGVSVWRAFGKQGYFKMNGGTVSDNSIAIGTVSDGSDIGGGIYVRSSNVVLNGGNIINNTAQKGAGIYLKGESGSNESASLTMNNAAISNNTSAEDGGGIYADNYSILTLQNSSISENTAVDGSGAGILFGSESHGKISNIIISGNKITTDSFGNKGAGITASDDVKISGSVQIKDNYKAQQLNNVCLYTSNILKVDGALADNSVIGIANGGTGIGNYVAVGDGYTITENDRSKFSSDDTDYAVKPLNTDVEGNRVELGEIGTVILQSDNVIINFVSTTSGEISLSKKNQSTKLFKKNNLRFTITPAEGYAKTSDFSVKCNGSNTGIEYPTADEDGIYTVYIDSNTTKLNVYGIQRQYTLNFETNNGSSIEDQKLFKDGKISEPEEPTREGYTFEGWYSDENFETLWNFEKDTVTKNITLYAKWTPVFYTVSGTIFGGTDEDMSGTVVKLMQNNEILAQTTADAEGKFSFNDVIIGNYNIFAEKDDRRASLDVTIKKNRDDITLNIPDSNIETEVVVDKNTPKTTVSGLEALAEDSEYAPTGAEIVRIVLNVAAKD